MSGYLDTDREGNGDGMGAVVWLVLACVSVAVLVLGAVIALSL